MTPRANGYRDNENFVGMRATEVHGTQNKSNTDYNFETQDEEGEEYLFAN